MGKIKVKYVKPAYSNLTEGKVYDVVAIDIDGDIWVVDDNGKNFFLHPCESEIIQ